MTQRLGGSSSIPDLTKLDVYERRDETPQHILRVYRADQTFKHLSIHKVAYITRVLTLLTHLLLAFFMYKCVRVLISGNVSARGGHVGVERVWHNGC